MRVSGNPSRLCQKPFSGHFDSLRSIEPGFWRTSIEAGSEISVIAQGLGPGLKWETD
jgi:hypothetical protein